MGNQLTNVLALSKWPIEVIRLGIRLGISIPTITYMTCGCYQKNNRANWSSWVLLKNKQIDNSRVSESDHFIPPLCGTKPDFTKTRPCWIWGKKKP
jgi:hypothetical protein